MVTFAGVDHVSFTVTDLDVSQAFYTTALDFVMVLDVGYGRIFMHHRTGFTLSLMKHEGAYGLAQGQTSRSDIDALIDEHDLDLPQVDPV